MDPHKPVIMLFGSAGSLFNDIFFSKKLYFEGWIVHSNSSLIVNHIEYLVQNSEAYVEIGTY